MKIKFFCFAILFTFSRFLLDSLPGAYFYPSFFENFAPDTISLIEESNGFSLIDSPRIYYEGDSFINFNWFYNGFSINSVLDYGSPGILLPFSSIDRYELKGESPVYRNYGMNFVSNTPDETFSRITLSNAWTNLGSYLARAPSFVDTHPTTASRDPLLYSTRRKILYNHLVDYIYSKKFKHSALSFSFSYFDITRQFNDFNLFDNVFEESGELLLMHALFEKKYQDGSLRISGVFNGLSRDKVFAELGRLPQETREKEKYSAFSGLEFKKRRYNLKLSFLYENERFSPSQINFLKDLKDNDGEGFLPFERLGSFSGNVFRLSFDAPYVFADLKLAALKGREGSFDFNPISFDHSAYLVTLWEEGKSFRNNNVQMKIGTMLNTSFGDKLSLYAKSFLQYSCLHFSSSENNLNKLAIGFDVGIMLFKNKNPEILLSYGETPYELREGLNFFLEKNRPGGTIYKWIDSNNDLQYQNGEQGQIFGYTGGPFHLIDKRLKIPIKKRLLISCSIKLPLTFRLNIKGISKRIANNFWVKYKEDYGFYEMIDGQNFYFFTSPFKEYMLSNYGFDKNPFYKQLLFHLKGGENKKWFFSCSFMAHMGRGYTALGNGPEANDIGILNESQANPNSWINGYGRVDGDRAYVAKMYFGFCLTKKLFIAANFKYRDGNPFAFINTLYAHDQRVLYLDKKQGEELGPREDFLSDVSVKIKYNFRLFNRDAEVYVSLFNLCDFGTELSEYVFSGGNRYAQELQIPRSIRVGLSIKI